MRGIKNTEKNENENENEKNNWTPFKETNNKRTIKKTNNYCKKIININQIKIIRMKKVGK